MNAIREYVKVKNKHITIKIPENFIAEEVEIIILPVETKEKKSKDYSFSELLLKGPSQSDNEISEIESTYNWFRKWKM